MQLSLKVWAPAARFSGVAGTGFFTALASSGATQGLAAASGAFAGASCADMRLPGSTSIAETVQIARARANHNEVSLFHRVIPIAPFCANFCEATDFATTTAIFHL